MRKSKSTKRSSSAKKGGATKTVDQYLAVVPQPARTTLNKIRATIRAAAPPETIEIISYGIPAFRYKGVLVWYAAFAKHCSFFPTAAIIEKFKSELSGYIVSKGTIQFPTDKPLPVALVKKMVRARVAQIKNK